MFCFNKQLNMLNPLFLNIETRRLTYNATVSLDQNQLFSEPPKEQVSLKRKEDNSGNPLSKRAAKRAKQQQQQQQSKNQ
jgi:hypothetical protein